MESTHNTALYKRAFSGLRARLIVVVLAAMLPLVSLVIYDATLDREAALIEARSELQSLAQFAADDLETRISAARQLLRNLAEIPGVRDADPALCSKLLAAVLNETPRYTNFAITDHRGHLLCSARPATPNANYGDREYFRRVLAGKDYAVGKPVVGRTTRQSTLPVAWPIHAADGQIHKVIIAGFDLSWFANRFARSHLLAEMSTVIWDRGGSVLYHHPEVNKPADALLEAVERIERGATFQSNGVNGEHYVFAAVTPPVLSDNGLELAFGVSSSGFDEPIKQKLWRRIWVLLFIAAAVFALAWRIAEVSVRRPVARLARASMALRKGNLSARAAGQVPGGEIGVLTTEFNATAAALQVQSEKLHRTNRALRLLSECGQAVVRAESEQMLLDSICEIIVNLGGYRFVWIGYADNDAAKTVSVVARAGFEIGYLDAMNLSWADERVDAGLTGIVFRSGMPAFTADIANDPRFAIWRERALAREYASAAALPLVVEGHCLGVLSIYAAECGAFHEEEMPLLCELASDLAYGIDALRSRAGHSHAQSALKASEERFRLLVEGVKDYAIVLLDRDGNVLTWNSGAERIKGYPAAEIVGQHMSRFHRPEDRAAALATQMLTTAAAEGRCESEGWRVRKDGTKFWAHVTISALRGANGALIGFAKITRDITERKRAEEEIRELNAGLERRVAERTKQLEAADRAKSAFLATMSHEIRTPMNGVMGMVEVLMHERLSDHQQDLVKTIRDSATSLLGLIDDILDFSKIEAGRLDIEQMPLSLTDLVEGICGSLLPVAARRGVDISLFVSPQIPQIVLADEVRLRQVIYNLMGNALKFSGGRPEKRGKVSLRVEVAGSAPLYVSFRIIDNGIGMSAATLSGLFLPFTQGEGSTTRRFGGTGLGLAICKRLVTLMHGDIVVNSTVDAGSTFTATLPFEKPADQPASALPDLSGLGCVLLESPDLDADDLAAYLAHAGAHVHRTSQLDAALDAGAHSDGPVVLIQDAGRQPLAPTTDTALGESSHASHLLMTWGQRRRCRVEALGVVTLDRDAMRRSSFLRAILIAAGRASPEAAELRPVAPAAVDTASTRMTPAARSEGRLILVVEDDAINQKVILQQLALLGYSAKIASNGEEALRLWRDGGYALLLTDLHMPVMDGYALTEAIRQSEGGQRRIPILALTANALRGEANRARAVGMDDYLTKPVQLRDLNAALERYLPRTPETAAPIEQAQAVQKAAALPVLNVSVLEQLIGNDQETIVDFLSEYLQTAREQAVQLRAAVELGHPESVSAIAHKLKSSSRAVGALALGNVCAQLDAAGKAGVNALIVELLSEFEAHFTRVEEQIRRRLVVGAGTEQR